MVGGVHSGVCAWQGVCVTGGCAWKVGHGRQRGMHSGQTNTEAGGTHPSGMHSCLYLLSFSLLKSLKP